MKKQAKKLIISGLLLLSSCGLPQRPQSSLLENPNISIPETHETLYNSILDAATSNVDASSDTQQTVLFNLPEGSRIVPLREGGIAPFSGVLFNTTAAAGLEVETRGILQQCRINSRFDQQAIAAVALRDIATLRNVILTQQQSYGLMLQNRNQAIQEYERYTTALRTRSETEVYRIVGFTIGGVAIGAVATGLIVGLIPRN
jgi:hypothetical protein